MFMGYIECILLLLVILSYCQDKAPEYRETLTLTHSKVLVYCMWFLMFPQDGWKITGATNVSNIPDVSVIVEVLIVLYECIFMC